MSFTSDPQENLEIADQLENSSDDVMLMMDHPENDGMPEELIIFKGLKDNDTPIFNGIVDEWEEVEKDYGNDD